MSLVAHLFLQANQSRRQDLFKCTRSQNDREPLYIYSDSIAPSIIFDPRQAGRSALYSKLNITSLLFTNGSSKHYSLVTNIILLLRNTSCKEKPITPHTKAARKNSSIHTDTLSSQTMMVEASPRRHQPRPRPS